MRISYEGQEHQISGLDNGVNLYGTPNPVIVAGIPIAINGKFIDGVEDITVYKLIKNDEGEEVKVEVIPEVVLEDV